MFESTALSGSKSEQYSQLLSQARALMHGDPMETEKPAASWTNATGQQSTYEGA